MPSADGPTFDERAARRVLVGPDSACWRHASDVRLNLAILYPLLLQVAHPVVGAGVRDFSDFERDPYDRLLRTVDYVTLLVYGGENAIAAGRRLRALHRRFRGVRDDGTAYSALQPGAYAWVHATLLHSYVAGHAQFGRPMRPEVRERFYQEYRGLGRLIGVRPRDLPGSWDGFREYFDHVCATELACNDSVRRVLGAMTMSGPPLVPMPGLAWSVARIPLRRAIWLGGVGLLTPELRRRLEIRWSWRDELAFRGLGQTTRAMTALLPQGYQVAGPAQLAARREAIARGPLGAGAARRPRTPRSAIAT